MNSYKLDCRNQHCPMPIVNLAKRVKEIEIGDEIEFTADHEACVQDLPAWCTITRNELVSVETDQHTINAVIRRIR